MKSTIKNTNNEAIDVKGSSYGEQSCYMTISSIRKMETRWYDTQTKSSAEA